MRFKNDKILGEVREDDNQTDAEIVLSPYSFSPGHTFIVAGTKITGTNPPEKSPTTLSRIASYVALGIPADNILWSVLGEEIVGTSISTSPSSSPSISISQSISDSPSTSVSTSISTSVSESLSSSISTSPSISISDSPSSSLSVSSSVSSSPSATEMASSISTSISDSPSTSQSASLSSSLSASPSVSTSISSSISDSPSISLSSSISSSPSISISSSISTSPSISISSSISSSVSTSPSISTSISSSISSSPSPSGSTVSDAFTRSNGGLGANWTTVTGTTAPAIVSNVVAESAELGCAAYYSNATFQNNQYAICDISATTYDSAAGGDRQGVLLRVATGATTGYTGHNEDWTGDDGNHYLVIGKYVAGTYTELGSYAFGATPPTWLKFTASGSTLKLYSGTSSTGPWTERISLTDTSIASGKPGIIVKAGQTDAVARVDNFEAGDL